MPQFEIFPEEEIPDIETLKQHFESIEELLQTNASIEELEAALCRYPILSMQLVRPGVDFTNSSIYRARQPSNDEDIEAAAVFGIAPAHGCDIGRANKAKVAVFYGSLLVDTAIQETFDQSKGDIIYVGEWQLLRPINIKQFAHRRESLKNDTLDDLHQNVHEFLNETSEYYSKDKRDSIKYMSERLGDYFLREKDYRISSILANRALFEFRPGNGFDLDAIAFPSIVKDHTTINFAMTSQCVEDVMVLRRVQKLQVTGLSMQGADVVLLEIGKVEGDRIEWYEPRYENVRLVKYEARFFPEINNDYRQEFFYYQSKRIDLRDFMRKIGKDHKPEIVRAAFNDHGQKILDEMIHEGESFSGKAMLEIPLDSLTYEGSKRDKLVIAFDVEARYFLRRTGS